MIFYGKKSEMNGCLYAFLLCVFGCLDFLTNFFFSKLQTYNNHVCKKWGNICERERGNWFDPYKILWLQGLEFFRILKNTMEVPPKSEAATITNCHILGPWVNTQHSKGPAPLGRKRREDRDCNAVAMVHSVKVLRIFFFFHIFLPLTSVYMLVLLQRKAQDCSPCKTSVLVIDLKEVRNGLGMMTITKHHTADNKPTAKFNEWVFFHGKHLRSAEKRPAWFCKRSFCCWELEEPLHTVGNVGGLRGVTKGSVERLQGMNGSQQPELLRCQWTTGQGSSLGCCSSAK